MYISRQLPGAESAFVLTTCFTNDLPFMNSGTLAPASSMIVGAMSTLPREERFKFDPTSYCSLTGYSFKMTPSLYSRSADEKGNSNIMLEK